MKIFFIIGAFFILITDTTWAQTQESNSCLACHDDYWQEMKGSVHAQQGISCYHCHGGDPTKADQESAKDPATGYIGIPDKQQIANICGGCHSDVEKMNFYGIRTDQLARYKTSHHGKKLLLGNDTRVAVCSDCHGYHDVLPVSDPNSPVYPLNVPKTCNRCHGNEKLMSAYHLPADIFKIYQNSVHGKALLEKKDLSVANCASCHGSHGAVPPGVKDLGATCGKCHINEKKYFLESVHAKPMGQGKFSECISCHSNHGVQPATEALFQQACVKCHEAGSPAFKEGEKILRLLSGAKEHLSKASGIVRQASIEGIFVEDEEAILEEVKTHVVEMEPLQHTLSSEKISQLYEKAQQGADEIKNSINEKRQSLKWRKITLIPLWIFIVVISIALLLRFKELKHHKDKGS